MLGTTAMLTFSLYASSAFAAGGDCPSAPRNYDGASCHAVCARDTFDPAEMRCDLSGASGNNEVVVVTGYRNFAVIGTTRYSAWGTAAGIDFCCTEVSSASNPLNSVRVLTGDGDDEVWLTAFDAAGNAKNLTSNPSQTTPDWFVGYVYPGAGNDQVHGSNSKASDYMDHLTGEDGRDTIFGNKGPDFISVAETRAGGTSANNQGESVYGGKGRDEIVGATNDISATDTIFVDGGPQNDLLCTGPVNALTGQQVFFFGGRGRDEIYSFSSFVPGFAGPIDGEGGSDGCDNPGGGTESRCERAFNPGNFTAWAPMVCQ